MEQLHWLLVINAYRICVNLVEIFEQLKEAGTEISPIAEGWIKVGTT